MSSDLFLCNFLGQSLDYEQIKESPYQKDKKYIEMTDQVLELLYRFVLLLQTHPLEISSELQRIH